MENTRVDEAAAYFADRLRTLMGGHLAVQPRTGRQRRVTPLSVHRMLQVEHPDLKLSQTQWYRFCNGVASPRLNEVCAVADIFGVTPSYFVRDTHPH